MKLSEAPRQTDGSINHHALSIGQAAAIYTKLLLIAAAGLIPGALVFWLLN